MGLKNIFIIGLLALGVTAQAQHIIPETIRPEVEAALECYPELMDTPIEFKFQKDIKKSTMQARPTIGSFFKPKSKRAYTVFISRKFKISGEDFETTDIPSDVFTGWIAHELGHIVDYSKRSNGNLIVFGIKYLFSDDYIVEAERRADSYAVKHDMGSFILKTKNFILNRANISKTYVARIKKYYLSPEEIMALVEERDALKEEENEL